MIASSAGHEEIVSQLLAKGAQVNAVNNTGQCSLHYAASKDRYPVRYYQQLTWSTGGIFNQRLLL